MSAPFWFDKQSHVTLLVINEWCQNEMSWVLPISFWHWINATDIYSLILQTAIFCNAMKTAFRYCICVADCYDLCSFLSHNKCTVWLPTKCFFVQFIQMAAENWKFHCVSLWRMFIILCVLKVQWSGHFISVFPLNQHQEHTIYIFVIYNFRFW